MIAVLVGLNLFGILGMFLAPPLLATLKVLFIYAERKILDEDPWPEEVFKEHQQRQTLLIRAMNSIGRRIQNAYQKVVSKKEESEEKDE